MLDLDYRAAERTSNLQRALVVIAKTVYTKSEAHHVHLEFGEALDARSVEDMPERPVSQRCAQTLAHLLEQRNLATGQIVVDILVGSCEVGIERFHLKVLFHLHEGHQGVQLLLHEAQTVHAGVESDMDGIAAAA